MKLFSYEKSIGGVVFRRENGEIKYFVIQHSRESHHWSFPKGHIEENETAEGTLRREIKEETGIEQMEIIPGFLQQERYFYAAKGKEKEWRKEIGRGIYILKDVKFFLVETQEKEIKLSLEHQNYDWLPFADALKRITHKQDKNILKQADKFLANL